MTTTVRDDILSILQKSGGYDARQQKKITDILASCPRAGSGVHRWLFNTALKLHHDFTDKPLLAHLLWVASASCGRDVSEGEIDNAVANSQRIAEGTSANGLPRLQPRWPNRNEKEIEAIAKTGPGLAGLIELSPTHWEDDSPHTEEIIDVLFPGNPLLCAGRRKEQALTRSRGEWRGFMANQQLVVPSTMIAIWGKTKNGRDGMRCLANVGPRRFAVIEFDQGDFDQHAALLIHLAKYAPLVLVVHSGNKSLHGWFYCAGEPDDKVEKFFRYAVSLGADPATWTPCQYVRMPDGTRDNGKRQRVVYFNPNLMEGL